MKCATLYAVLGLVITFAWSKPTEADGETDGHHGRKFGDLSDQDHFDSDHKHNVEYDHEAFLGDEANEFDDLTPEESKEKLAIIFDKIDKDSDGFVTEKELQDWIMYVQGKYIDDDTQRQWSSSDMEGDTLKWKAYLKNTYGISHEDQLEGDDYAKFVARDRTRWKKADLDGDEDMSKEEFRAFLHPEDAPHMHDVIIDETLEDIDGDGDGYISLEEYLDDMQHSDDKMETFHYNTQLDKDRDHLLDRGEIFWWLTDGYDPVEEVETETTHLMKSTDQEPLDNMLSKDEVLAKYDLFVGSQATDFGDALYRHDEF